VHIFVLHAFAVIFAFIQGGELHQMNVVTDASSIPAWYGVSLPGVYLAWAIVVITMYPLCRWFARIKRERDEWWLSYL
jgi:hypothetical protein